MLNKYVYDSKISGPRLLLLGAVHGNETVGSKEILKLKEALDNKKICLKSGCLTLMPVCNPLAHAKGVRYVEKNLNRLIRLYEKPSCPEEEFAHEVASEILKNDYVLDLHSTHNAGEPPFAFLDYPSAENQKLVAAVDVPYVICNWPEIYKNAPITDYCTEYCAHASGKSCITLECGYHYDAASQITASESIYNLLARFGMIDRQIKERTKKYLDLQEVVVKKRSGRLQKNYRHLDRVSAGEVIGIYDNGEKVVASKNGYILIPNHEAADNTEWFYLAVAKTAD